MDNINEITKKSVFLFLFLKKIHIVLMTQNYQIAKIYKWDIS